MKKIFLFSLFILSSVSLRAQTEMDAEVKTKTKATASLNALAGIPVGIFDENQSRWGLGLGGNLLFEIREPISIGADFSWQSYDRESEFFIEFDEFGNPFDLKEEASNHILGFSGLVHVEPDLNFFIQPYFEGTFGVNRFYTKTVLTDVSLDEQINVNNNHSDWSLSYGGALGLLINVWQDLLFIDLKCAYRVGNTAEYYTRIEGANFTVPITNFELKTSPTNFLMPQIGVTFLLNNPEEDEYYEEEE